MNSENTTLLEITDELSPYLIEKLRSDFKLSDTSIAVMFNVSRHTVYNWRIRKTSTLLADRIYALIEALQQVNLEDIRYLQRTLFYPTADGLLIQDALSDESWNKDGSAGVNRVVTELVGNTPQLRNRDINAMAKLNRQK